MEEGISPICRRQAGVADEARSAASLNKPTTKAPAQRSRILGLLRERGPVGATNRELKEIGFRYGGRLHELRREGFSIETIREGEGLFRFVLLAEPNHPKPLPAYSGRRASEQAPLCAEAAR